MYQDIQTVFYLNFRTKRESINSVFSSRNGIARLRNEDNASDTTF